jgi:hypothetical protein
MSAEVVFARGGPLGRRQWTFVSLPGTFTAWQHRKSKIVEIGSGAYVRKPSFHGRRDRNVWTPHFYIREGQSCSYRYVGTR